MDILAELHALRSKLAIDCRRIGYDCAQEVDALISRIEQEREENAQADAVMDGLRCESQASAWKIRDSKTGLFKCSGHDVHFDKRGGTWSTVGAVKAIITKIKKHPWHRKTNFGDWEIVEFVSSPSFGRVIKVNP